MTETNLNIINALRPCSLASLREITAKEKRSSSRKTVFKIIIRKNYKLAASSVPIFT